MWKRTITLLSAIMIAGAIAPGSLGQGTVIPEAEDTDGASAKELAEAGDENLGNLIASISTENGATCSCKEGAWWWKSECSVKDCDGVAECKVVDKSCACSCTVGDTNILV